MIPRELETILLKATRKSPKSRYATAQDLAADLRRFLEDRPIKAKRPAWHERLAKWTRRHRMVVATAGILLVLTTVGLALGTRSSLRGSSREHSSSATSRRPRRARPSRKRNRSSEISTSISSTVRRLSGPMATSLSPIVSLMHAPSKGVDGSGTSRENSVTPT